MLVLISEKVITTELFAQISEAVGVATAGTLLQLTSVSNGIPAKMGRVVSLNVILAMVVNVLLQLSFAVNVTKAEAELPQMVLFKPV